MVQRKTVKNFYRALAASAYVAGASAAGLALGGPPGAAAAAAAATANLASPLGVAAVEIAAEVGTDAALDSTKMAMGGLVTEPTFAMIGEAGPEMVIPLTGPGAFVSPLVKPKRKRSRSARAADKKLSKAFKMANASLRTKKGALRKGKTQADVAKMAHRLRKKM
jgi:SLT domain-containing protein